MKPGMLCLLALLREADSFLRFPESEWLQALELAQGQNVAPVCAALMRTHLPKPKLASRPALERELTRVEREAAVSAFWWTSELTGLLAAFSHARLDVLPLKGPMLAERLYGNTALRTCRDLDLLVRPGQFADAQRLLGNLGFKARGRGDDYHQTWMRGTTGIELHFNVENPLAFAFDLEGAWKRASLISFHGQPAWQFAPADELAFLCLHGTRHRFDRLSLILDVARMLTHIEREEGEQPAAASTAQPAAMQDVVKFGCCMAAYLQPECSHEGQNHLSTDHPREGHLQGLAGSLWHELLTREQEKLDWRSQHRFFQQLERTRIGRMRRRARHLRILLSRLIEEDYAFASLLGFERDWQARLLRPVRLAVGWHSRG